MHTYMSGDMFSLLVAMPVSVKSTCFCALQNKFSGKKRCTNKNISDTDSTANYHSEAGINHNTLTQPQETAVRSPCRQTDQTGLWGRDTLTEDHSSLNTISNFCGSQNREAPCTNLSLEDLPHTESPYTNLSLEDLS